MTIPGTIWSCTTGIRTTKILRTTRVVDYAFAARNFITRLACRRFTLPAISALYCSAVLNLARLAQITLAAAVIDIELLTYLIFTADVIIVLAICGNTLRIFASLSYGIFQLTFLAMLTAMVSTVGLTA